MEDNADKWLEALANIPQAGWFKSLKAQSGREKLVSSIASYCGLFVARKGAGGAFVKAAKIRPKILEDWIADAKLGGACNHESRAHMESDLHRYMFASAEMAIREADSFSVGFGKTAPLRLSEFGELLPDHENVKRKNDLNSVSFSDRFKVQRANAPASTIVGHISKDGHYFIHYDPSQCRSLTVREAARLQTFPDNFFFEGTRGAGYKQVGGTCGAPVLGCTNCGIGFGNYFHAQKT